MFDDLAGIHHGDAIGGFCHDAEIVRDENHRHPHLALQLLQQFEDLCLDRHVERRCRLVGDQHGRAAGERHRDHHALPHAAGELVRVFVDPLFGSGDAHPFEHLDGPLPRFARG